VRGYTAAASIDAWHCRIYRAGDGFSVGAGRVFAGLVERAAQRGLVRKEHDLNDRRYVLVSLTAQGEQILAKLTELHKEEVKAAREALMKVPKVPAQVLEVKKKSV